MSDKPFSSLNIIDQTLRKITGSPSPDNTGTQIVIEKICGFEYFNTRPYHNYEDWGDGYAITMPNIILNWAGNKRPLQVEAEDLDDAVAKLQKAYATWKELSAILIGQEQKL